MFIATYFTGTGGGQCTFCGSTNNIGLLQELGEGSVDSVGLLITLDCWLLDQFVLRRNARIVPKSFAPRPSHVDIHAMEYKEKKNVFHVCVDERLQYVRMMRMK